MSMPQLGYVFIYATFVAGIASILLRFRVRTQRNAFGNDDYIMLLVALFSVAQQIVLHMLLHWGCGQ